MAYRSRGGDAFGVVVGLDGIAVTELPADFSPTCARLADGAPAAEVCNGLDDDCNRVVDHHCCT